MNANMSGRYTIILFMILLTACNTNGGGSSSSSPGTIQIEASIYDSTEGTVVNIRVNRSGGNNGAVSVDYTTLDDSAVSGSDYTLKSGTLTWQDNVSGNQTISIPITDDSEAEALESFSLTLSNISGATLGTTSSALINIIDNDVAAVSASGAITALSSATVNGVRYDTNATTVNINGQSALASDLELGQIVSINGDINFSNATGTASNIEYSSTIIGPLESLDATLKHLIVLGQNVFIKENTAFDESIDSDTLVGLTVGSTIEVSGFRNKDDEIIATRIAPHTSGSDVQLIGTVSALDIANMLFNIDRLTVDYSSATLIDLQGGTPVNGQPVLVRGTLSNGILVVSEIKDVTFVTTTPGARVLLGGLVTQFTSATDFELNGFPVVTDVDTQFFDGTMDDLEANAEITIDGEISSGSDAVLANEIYFDGLVSDRTVLPYDFKNFTNISASGFFKLTVTQGANFAVEVIANPDTVADIQITQTGDTINFIETPNSSALQIQEIFVTLPTLSRIAVAEDSLANVTVRNFNQALMEINVDGVSILRGEALNIGNLTATVSGVSALDLGNIDPLGGANVDISGVSRATLNMAAASTITGSVTTGQGTGHSILYFYGTGVTNSVTTDTQSETIRLGDTKL